MLGNIEFYFLMKKKIAVITGGNSSEYVISLKSAENVATALDKEKYDIYTVRIKGTEWTLQDGEYAGIVVDKNDFSFEYEEGRVKFDAAYVMIHGTPGEDGLLQSYFEMQRIPYTTGNPLNMSLTFNKYFCNNYLQGFGITVADSCFLTAKEEYNITQIIDQVGLPCFVKPNDAGSSFGVSKVKTEEELSPAIDKAFSEGAQVLVESFIEGTEVTCGVVKTKEREIVMPITEIVSKNEFFDFQAKYTPEFVDEITPARISTELTEKVQSIASRVYDILECKGIVRVDFIIQDNEPYFLEVNTVPGMSAESLIPKQLEEMKMNQSEVFDLVLDDILKS